MHQCKQGLRMLTVSIATGTTSSWSDEMTLQMSDWLFYSEDMVFVNRVAILGVAFFPVQNYMSDTSRVFCSHW